MDDTERLERAQEALGYTFQHPEVLYQSLRTLQHRPTTRLLRTDGVPWRRHLGHGGGGLPVPPLVPWKKER